MKKKVKSCAFPRNGMVKLLRIMRLTFFIVLIGLLKVSASVYSQQAKLSIQLDNVTMEEAFRAIEDNSNYVFFYNAEQIQLDRRVSLSVQNQTVDEILTDLFKNYEIDYKIVDRRIVLFPKAGGELPAILKQSAPVKGTVTGQNGEPIPGATVVVKGTTQGTITDAQGEYVLNGVPGNARLQFSFVGMKTKEVDVADKSIIDVSLEEETIGLDEVVAIGYGTIKKSDLTGSVSSVKSEDLVKVPVLGVNEAIQGRAAGVYVSNNQSQPGGNVTVRIRGTNSIQGDNEPLYIIDGYVGGRISTVDPTDIESVEILKDASSTAIYGSRGANGVVIVTTKSGKAGKNTISFDAYYGIQKVAKKIDMLDAIEYARFANAVRISTGLEAPYPNPENLPYDTDWQDEIFTTAPMQNYSLSSSGGSDKLTYYISGNYIQQDGVVIETGYNRYNLRLNLDSKLSDNANVGARIGISRTYRTRDYEETLGASSSNHPVARTLNWAPTLSPYDENGELVAQIMGLDGTALSNPIHHLRNVDDHVITAAMNGNIFTEIQLIKDLKFKSTFGFDIVTHKDNRYKPSYVFENQDGYRNRAIVNMSMGTTWLSENYFTYDKTFGEQKLQVLAGFTANKFYAEGIDANVSDFAVDDFEYHNLSAGDGATDFIGSDMSHWSRLSYYGRIQYNVKEKYLFTVNGRYDGSSRFGKNNKWAFFPSAAFAWRISEEPFIQELGIFSNLKFRASYGVSGSEALGPFSSFSQMTSNANSGYILGGTTVVGFIPTKLPNPDLRWEQTSQTDIGMDVSFWGGRLNVVADYYYKETTDLFLDKPIPKTNGVATVRQNIGSLMNEGIEFGIDAVLSKRKLGWNVGFNITKQRSEILDLGFDDSVEEQQIILGSIEGDLKIGEMQVMRVGEPLGSFFGYETDGVWQESELATAWTQFGSPVKAGDLKFVDQDGDMNVNASDRRIIGSAQPNFFGGFNNSFSYHGFDLSVFMQYAIGNNVLNATRHNSMNMGGLANKLQEANDAWTPENTDTNVPKVGYIQPGVITDLLVEDASFLRVREVSLGYTLPKTVTTKLNVSNVRLYASASNLFTFTKYSGYDPEVNIYGSSITNLNTDNGSYPKARTVLFGVNLTF